ncbi:MAG TPA: GTP diphosphokinase [Gammaproteobacteria bacterium]|nr:GTP diphosphokinase [Gammaproteobacteria bacterium]
MVSVADQQTGATSKDPLDAGRWLAALEPQRPPAEMAVIRRACELARGAHAGQFRANGDPYFQHSLAVAHILNGLGLDYETLSAALLHDVVEDTALSLADIESLFGPVIAGLVDGVTKMTVIQPTPDSSDPARRARGQTESLRKMLLAMVEDVRVVLIKLADRLHNMRTLAALTAAQQQRIAEETLNIYAPLANRLGIWQIKWELEDLAFRHLHPRTYKHIAAMVAERRVDRENYIARFMDLLSQKLAAAGIAAEVSGRPKHIYSIWRKMLRKGLDYHQIYDVRAVRILVGEVPDCYAALGVVHGLWQYLPGEFDDYIATPKENNYQSIHTAVLGPQGKTVEVQIRTRAMHEDCELGVAAHWRYKEGAAADPGFDRKISLLRQLLDWKDDLAASGGLGDDLQADLFEERVYVFTPRGDIIDLPRGATALDFAYHIHTELGHRCRGAKINGAMVPLTQSLSTGQRVEILTARRGHPSRDWLNPHLGYLKTSRARSKVQSWFKQQDFEANVAAGRAGLEKELHRLGLAAVNYEALAKGLHFGSSADLFAALGRGDIKTSQAIGVLQGPPAAPEPITPRPATGRDRSGRAANDVEILGVGNLLTHLARCCKPVAGDDVVGYITRGRGVTIHRRDCPNALRYANDSPERLIEVQWGGAGATYPVDIGITAYDRQGLLRDISAVLANEKVNVLAVHTESDRRENLARMSLTLEIAGLPELSRVLTKIGQLTNVVDVRRETA